MLCSGCSPSNCAGVCCNNVCYSGSSCPSSCSGCSGTCCNSQCFAAGLQCCGCDVHVCVASGFILFSCSAGACPANSYCTTSQQCQCNTGFSVCGSSCVNLQTDSSNCGQCGTVCPCSGGQCSELSVFVFLCGLICVVFCSLPKRLF